MAKLDINLGNVDAKKSFDPIPAGWYTAEITGSEMHPTKAGNGHYLKLEFTVLDGDDAATIGRHLWTNLNLDNPNQAAVDIAYSELKGICDAIGHGGVVGDSEELHGAPMEIKVSIREDTSGKYQPQNEIKDYRPSGNAAPVAKAPKKGATPPWAKK